MDQADPRIFYDTSSRRYGAGNEIASGGEGSIHEVQGEPGRVMKLYGVRGQRLTSERREQLQELRQKVKLMISRPPGAPQGLPGGLDHHYWTWPIERMFTRDGVFSGYVMPRLSGIKGEEFIQLGSGFSWKARLVAARNLAKLVAATHRAGYIIGDLNPRNLFFSPFPGASTRRSGGSAAEEIVLPSVTDTDSFQVGGIDGGAILYACRVQNPEYSAPELINSDIFDRTVEQDYFCLAIIVFQLLSLGLHPYSGTTRDSINQEIRTNIARGRNVLFSDESELTPPKLMIDLEILPRELHELFEHTFRKGDTVTRARATADEWDAALERIVVEDLQTCATKPNHYYGSHLPYCPWCRYAERLGGDPFNLPPARRQGNPQAPREIETDSIVAKLPGSPRITTRRGSGAVPPITEDGSDTHFGTIPEYLAPERDPDSDAGAVSEVTLPKPVESEPEPNPPAVGPVDPPPEPQLRRSIPPFAVLIALTAVVFVLAFAFREPLRAFWTAGVQPVITNLLDREQTATPTFTTPEETDVCQGSCLLTIEVCIDTLEPFDCDGTTFSEKPESLILFGPNGSIVQTSPGTLPNTYIRRANRLQAGSYRIAIDDSNLSAYTRCPTNRPDVNPPGGDSVRIDLTENRRIAFAYCLR